MTKILFVPMYRAGVSYIVTVGRRWSILDKMLLVEMAIHGRSVRDLATISDLPDRLVVESLINLLRSNLIEVRTGSGGAVFTATGVGKRRAADGDLRPELRRESRSISLCMDRLTGCWLRPEELDLFPAHDLPDDACVATPVLATLNYDDPDVRGLIYLGLDEDLDSFEPSKRPASHIYARVGVAFGEVSAGLPPSTPLRLLSAVQAAVADLPSQFEDPEEERAVPRSDARLPRDTITAEDVIVGGPQHLELFRGCLASAKTHAVVHSCFVSPATVRLLLPDIERAARRGVKVDCLWGLRDDPEAPGKSKPIDETAKLFDGLPVALRKFALFSRVSSNSHAKVIIYDDARTGGWTSVVGSCNFLSSDFDSIEISVRTRSLRLASQLMSFLIAAQLPASGAWSQVARRLNATWNRMRRPLDGSVEQGAHSLQLLADAEHYSAVTMALDRAAASIVIGCDLCGAAAETSVLVPLEAAARNGVHNRIYYHRFSRYLEQEGRCLEPAELGKRDLNLVQISDLHGKFLAWDEGDVAVTSFNWLATVSRDTRTKGAELGVLISGPGTRAILAGKLLEVSGKMIDAGSEMPIREQEPSLVAPI